MLVSYICKPSRPVRRYFSHLQSKINENQPLDLLKDVWFMVRLQNWLPLKQTKKPAQRSAAQRENDHDNTMNKKRSDPSTEQKKRRRKHWQIQIIFTRRINTVHKFLCTHNAICMHVMYTVVTVHAICGGLLYKMNKLN